MSHRHTRLPRERGLAGVERSRSLFFSLFLAACLQSFGVGGGGGGLGRVLEKLESSKDLILDRPANTGILLSETYHLESRVP